MYPSSVFTGTNSSNIDLCTLETCGGHALYETAGWYSDEAIFVHGTHPWLLRGGYYYRGADAGVFFLDSDTGNANDDYGFRLVAIKGA